jgi:probable F420-dependent oxidoreductase
MKLALGMPFLQCPPNPAFLSGTALAELGVSAEAAGFAAAYFSEHPAPSQTWREAGGHDALDPFVGLSFVAAATQVLRLLTCLVVVPYRNPFLLAKAVASLDVLSGGRVELGLGAGYHKREFAALGVAFDERNTLFDEALDVLPLAWSGEPVTFQGSHFSAAGVACQPVPAQKPHPPLWLGGNSMLTRRRVVDRGTGWMPLPNPAASANALRSPPLESPEDLAAMLTWCAEYADSVGRPAPAEVMFALPPFRSGDSDQVLREHADLTRRFRDIGVTWLSVGIHADSVSETQRLIERYRSKVLEPVAGHPSG